MTSILARYPAFAAAGASVSAVLIFTGYGAVEILSGVILAVITALVYYRIPGTLRVYVGIFCIVALRALVLSPESFSAACATWSGVVESVKPSASSQRAVVTLSTQSRPRVMLTLTDLNPELTPGDSVSFTSPLCRAGRYIDVPGMRMSEMTDRAERISALATVSSGGINIIGHSDAFPYNFISLRRRLVDAVYATPLSAYSADLLVASTLGSGDAPADIKEVFRAAGISHLLCVSGFHVGIIAAIVSFVLFPLRVLGWRRLRYILLLLVVWMYAFITGFAPSVIRAGIMLTAYVLARSLQREALAPNALFVALGATLAIDPYSLWSAGFQLSFSAVAGILLFGLKLNPVRRRIRVWFKICEIFVVPLAALLGSLPVSLLWFGKIAILSVPVNALACFIFPLYMLSSSACVLLWYMGFDTTMLCGSVDVFARVIISFIDHWAAFVESYSATILLSSLSIACVTCALMAFGAALHFTDRRRRLIAATVCVAFMLCTGCERSRSEDRLLITGDTFSSRAIAVRSGRTLDVILEGSGKCSPKLLRFADAVVFDSMETFYAKSGLVDICGYKIFIADRKSQPLKSKDIDCLFISRRFIGNPYIYLDAMPEAHILISPALSQEIQSEIEAACRMRGRKCVCIAHDVVFYYF